MTQGNRPTASAARDGERGGALIVVLVIATLSVLVLGSLSRSMIEAEIAGRAISSSEAFYHAEAGVQHALAALMETPSGFTDDLVGPDGVAGTSDDGYVLGTDPVAFGDGFYLARVVNNWAAGCTGDEDSDSDTANDGLCDGGESGDGDADDDGMPDPVDSDGIIHLWVLGFSGDSRAAIRAAVDVDAGAAFGPGIYTEGVIFSGNGAEVYATEATIHGNGGLVLHNNSSIFGDPGTSAVADVSSGTEIDGERLDNDGAEAYSEGHSGLPTIEIPEIVPADYAHLADYRFASDGTVYDSSGDAVASGEWNSWRFASGEWKLNNVDGDYQSMVGYFETDVFVSAQDEIETTIISEGSVRMNGGRVRAARDDLLVVAGGDVSIGGNADGTAYSGNIYAREQIETFGASGIRGNIVAQDAATDHDLVRGHAIQLGSDIFVDPGLPNPLGAGGTDLTDWYFDADASHREIFQ